MKRMAVLLALVALVLNTADVANAGGHFVRKRLVAVNASGVTGHVDLIRFHGTTTIKVVARGLTPSTQYTSFYYDDGQCMVDPEVVGTFTADANGVGRARGEAEEPIDEIGSVSVRTPDYSTLFACATLN